MQIFRFLLLAAVLFSVACKKKNNVTDDPGDQNGTTVDTLVTPNGVQFVRTPNSYFENLSDWPYSPQYVEIDGLRQAYFEVGAGDGEVVLLLHGHSSWSYLYRKMIPELSAAGFRVIAMDHLGFGRSDKPVNIEDYSYLGHCDRLARFLDALDLQNINLFAQDWGARIGLRIAGLDPGRFARIAIGNGELPVSGPSYSPVTNPNEITDLPSPFGQYSPQQSAYWDSCQYLLPEAHNYAQWMEYSMKGRSFAASEVLEAWTWGELSDEVKEAYDAPFPRHEYMAGARVLPSLINELAGNTGEAWIGLASYTKPFMTIWGGNDPGEMGACPVQQYFIDNVPGAGRQNHLRLEETSHYLQEDAGTSIAQTLISFFGENPPPRVGFEIIQIKSLNEILVWINREPMSQEEFDAIDLPLGWMKNQPREGDPDFASFARSPDAANDGDFTNETHFGYPWLHNATIVDMDYSLPDDEGLLDGRLIAKYHEIVYHAGRTLKVLTSPNGDKYVRVSRDANRTTDNPTVPSAWQLSDYVTPVTVTFELPNPTINIRMDNEDSFQGPVVF